VAANLGASAPTEPAPESRVDSLIAYLVLVIAVAVTVFLAIAVAVRAGDSGRSDRFATARSQSLSIAAARATVLLSYDYRTIDTLASVNRPFLTAACATGYAGQLDAAVRADAVANKSVLRATVRSVAIQQLSATRSTVLVIVDEERTGSDRTGTQNQQLGVSVRLVRSEGQWLVDDLVAAIADVDAAPRPDTVRCS
jgi:hypothetical protein